MDEKNDQMTPQLRNDSASGASSERSIESLRRRRQQMPAPPAARRAGEPPAPTKSPSAETRSTQRHPWWSLRRYGVDLPLMALIVVISCISIVPTWPMVGWSWDESYYLPPASLARDWLFAGMPASPEALQRYWREINELPAFCKWIWAVSLMILEPITGPIAAMRAPSALFFGLTLALLYAFLRRDLDRGGALVGVVALATIPPFFGHAHLATTEIFTVFIILATTHIFRLALDNPRRYAWLVGVMFGLAINTKINAFFLFPALVLWGALYRPERIAWPVVSMVFLAPIVFVLTWPWLWHEPKLRILEYLHFHAGHQETGVFYMGQRWGFNQPGAPWHYPFVMLAVTMPIMHLVGLGLGLARSSVCLRSPLVGLMLIQAAVPLLIIAAPGQPKYDGVRLFLPAYPFIAGLIAFGYEGLVRSQSSVRRPVALAICIILLGWLGVRELSRSHPFHLSYFSAVVGGLPGAYQRGYETTYWGERLTKDVLDWLNDPAQVPEGSAIKTRAMFSRVLKNHQQWGHLRSDLHIDELPPGRTAYDFHIIQARRGMWANSDLPFASNMHRARAVFEVDGVPFFLIFGTLDELLRPSPTP